jgi:hypothetical protein
MSFAGSSTVKEAYVTLIDLAVVLQMVSYSYVYLSLFRVAFGPLGALSPNKLRIRFAAVSVILTTSLGLVVAFIPSHQVDSVWRFEIKMVVSCVAVLGIAAGLFWYYSHHRANAPALH